MHRMGNGYALMEIKMIFEQFQVPAATPRTLVQQLPMRAGRANPLLRAICTLTYLYIEEMQPHWSDAAKARGKWYLLIARDEWITDDLETLERKLYDWAASEGYFEEVRLPAVVRFRSAQGAKPLDPRSPRRNASGCARSERPFER